MTGILAITDVPLKPDYPNGFSGRYHHFLRTAASRWPIDLLVPRQADEAGWTIEDFLPPEISPRRLVLEEVNDNRLNRKGTLGRLHRFTHYAFGRLPYMSHPRRLHHLVDLVRTDQTSLVVIFLPYLAHLSLRLPASVPTVLVLEEGMEKALNWSTRQLPPRRRQFVMSTESKKVARLYRALGSRPGSVVAISDEERTWFSQFMPYAHIETIEHGIDPQYFRPRDQPVEYDIAIFGNMAAGGANLEGALELFDRASEESLAPPVRHWAFIGGDPGSALLALRDHRVTVTGYVGDVRPYYAGSRVVVVPARRGTGAKTTLLQAWAMAKPVVATRLAVTGLPARHGENVLIGDSPDEMLRHIESLIESDELRQRVASRGRETVVAERDIRDLSRRFADLCEEAMSAAGPQERS
jgi:glycosyltransferase involved in cell wall biosynthesis